MPSQTRPEPARIASLCEPSRRVMALRCEARFARKGSARADHRFRPDPFVELLAGDEAELDRRLAQCLAGLVRGLRDLGGLVVADVGVQGGDEHERVLEVVPDALEVRLDADDAMLAKAVGAV